jgi:hypothetical protein
MIDQRWSGFKIRMIRGTMRYPSKRTEGLTCSQGTSNLNL